MPSPLAVALGPRPGDRLPASVVGLEHEYSLSVAGEPLDFRDLIHGLAIPGRRLDPGDLNAYRCPSGLVLTCDATDAEVVSPPLPVRPGFAGEVAAWADHGRAELLRLLPPGVAVTPFSTHISASMPDAAAAAACGLFARTFAPALMLMLDGADSHGVFVRPRPGRLELCGEHATGARLGAAAAMVVGGARACAAAVVGTGNLPPLLAVDVRPSTGRQGLFVGRHLAFGYDLYAAGRRAALPLEAGGVMPAQEHLRRAWDAARAALGADAGDADLQAGDAMVSGSAPLGVEGAGDDGVPRPWLAPMAPSPFGDVLRPRRRPGLDVAPEAATWDFTVFRLTGPVRHAYACVPGPQLGQFLERLDAGLLDGLLGDFLDAAPTGRVLTVHDETAGAGLWDEAVIGPDMLPYERSAADGNGAGLVLPPSAPVGVAEQTAPAAYVRRGKAAVIGAPPAPLTHRPISATAPVTGVADLPAVPPPVPPPPAEPLPPQPLPAKGPRRRRRRAGILVGAFMVLLVAAGAAAMTGWFAGDKPAGVDIATSPAPESTNTTVEPSTTSPTGPTTTTRLDTTTVPSVAPSVVPTVPATTAPRPTSAVIVPPTPTVTTVPVDTTVSTTTTAVTVPPPTQFVVAVTSGILGCSFQPASANAVAGSTVRFRNDTGGGINVSIAPPAGPSALVSLDAGGTSGGYSLATPGSYAVTCSPGGDSQVGRMTVNVTNA